MQEKNKKHILRLSALVITLLYVLPVGYFLGLWAGVIDAMVILSLSMLLITKKSYAVALNVILFYAGLTFINILFYGWVIIETLTTPY